MASLWTMILTGFQTGIQIKLLPYIISKDINKFKSIFVMNIVEIINISFVMSVL